MNYEKILKWSLVGLLVVGLILSAYGFFKDWPTTEDISTIANAEMAINSAEAAIDNAKESIESAHKDIDSANKAVAEAEVAVSEAKSTKDKKAAEAAYKKAENDLNTANSILKMATNDQRIAEKDLPKVKKEIAEAESRMLGVDLVLWGGYILMIITIVAVVFGVVVVGGMNDPKNLIKLGIGVVAVVVLVLGAYLMASGKQPMGWTGEPIEKGTLMLTDTILNLAYLLMGGTIIALIAGWIIGLTRK